MVDTSAVLNITVAGFMGLTALVVLVANPRRSANVALAAFLLCIAGNFGTTQFAYTYPTRSVAWETWLQVAFVFFVMDAVALLYFASVFPRRNALHSPYVLYPALAAAAGVLVLVVTGRIGPWYGLTGPRLVLFGYDLVLTASALVGLLVSASRERSPVWRPQAHAAAAALGGAMLPRVGLFPVELGLVNGRTPAAWLIATLVVVALAALVYAAARLLGADRKGLRRPFRYAVLIASIFVAVWLLAAAVYASGADPHVLDAYLGKYQFPLRWILFGAIASVALLRFQIVRFEERLAEPLSYALPLAGALALALVASGAASETSWHGLAGFSAAQAAFLLVLGAGILVALRLRPRLHDNLVLPGGHGRLGLYRQVLAETLKEPTTERQRLLAELRHVCRVTPEQDRVMRELLVQEEALVLPGRLVGGRYRVAQEIGRGSTGSVWRAEDERLGRPVALKPLGTSTGASLEVAALTRVRHPHVVQVYDLLDTATGPVLVTELVEGPTLRQRLEAGRIPREDALRLGRELLGALGVCHEAGIVHGDVKPENLLLARDGAKLADFGLARVGDGSTTFGAGQLRGTARYLPPEALDSGRVTKAADLWAAALVVLECLDAGKGAGKTRERLDRLRRDEPLLADVLARALDRRPGRRYPTARALGDALGRAAVSADRRGSTVQSRRYRPLPGRPARGASSARS